MGEPEFIGVAQYNTDRGPEATGIYLAKVADNTVLPQNVVWQDVEKLEGMANFIKHQLVPIRMAVKKFNVLQ